MQFSLEEVDIEESTNIAGRIRRNTPNGPLEYVENWLQLSLEWWKSIDIAIAGRGPRSRTPFPRRKHLPGQGSLPLQLLRLLLQGHQRRHLLLLLPLQQQRRQPEHHPESLHRRWQEPEILEVELDQGCSSARGAQDAEAIGQLTIHRTIAASTASIETSRPSTLSVRRVFLADRRKTLDTRRLKESVEYLRWGFVLLAGERLVHEIFNPDRWPPQQTLPQRRQRGQREQTTMMLNLRLLRRRHMNSHDQYKSDHDYRLRMEHPQQTHRKLRKRVRQLNPAKQPDWYRGDELQE